MPEREVEGSDTVHAGFVRDGKWKCAVPLDLSTSSGGQEGHPVNGALACVCRRLRWLRRTKMDGGRVGLSRDPITVINRRGRAMGVPDDPNRPVIRCSRRSHDIGRPAERAFGLSDYPDRLLEGRVADLRLPRIAARSLKSDNPKGADEQSSASVDSPMTTDECSSASVESPMITDD